MKPYLISLASGENKQYYDSLQLLQNSVELIDVRFEPCNPIVTNYYIDGSIVKVGAPYPGNLSRFQFIPELDPNRWWIFTDTADVIFQKPFDLSDYEGWTDIIVCSEGETFKDNGFWMQWLERYPSIFSYLLQDRQVYNGGCWAMKGYKVLEFIQFLETCSVDFNLNEQSDQILLNLWLINQKYVGDQDIFTTLYNNIDKGYVNKTDKGFVNQHGELYTVVHANGNTKELL